MTSRSEMRWILIGGSGFLGTNLAKMLVLEGETCLIIDRVQPRWLQKSDGISFFEADVRDTDAYRHLIDANAVVVHMAANAFPGKSEGMLESEIQDDALPTVRLANLCAEIGVLAFLFCSSGGAIYGDQEEFPIHERVLPIPKSTHGAMKLATEHYLHIISTMRPLPIALLRIGNPYGPWHGGKRQGIVNVAMMAMLRGEPIELFGDGLHERDYIFSEDVACAIIVIGKKFRSGCEAFNIGTGTSQTLIRMVDLISDISGIRPEIRILPEREVDVYRNILDSTKIRTYTGWSPMISLEDGLYRTWQWAQQHHRDLP